MPGLNATSSEGGRKRPESSSPEKLKARNKEKFSGASEAEAREQLEKAKQDNYEEEFEQLLDKDDEEEGDGAKNNEDAEVQEVNQKQLKRTGSSNDRLDKKTENAEEAEEGEEGGEEDDYIDEEEMLDIAERCFVRIANAIMAADISVRRAFSPFIIREEFEGDVLELLSPIGFLEGVKEIGVTDLEEVEVACLMRVLTKSDLENAILLRELIVIMENFGIKDDEATLTEEESKPGKKRKQQALGLDLSQLDEKSIKILAKLMLALMELNVTLYDFFDGAIYEQLVKTKTKQNTVEIIAAKDFFELLMKRGVRKNATAHENLQRFLQLDPNYPHLIMLKKVAKALDEMAKNEELMEGILAAAVGEDVGGGEIEQPDERLGTIGEDNEEDKLIYDT